MACGRVTQAPAEPPPDVGPPRRVPVNTGPRWTAAERRVWEAEPGGPSLAAALAADEQSASLVARAKEKAAKILRVKSRKSHLQQSIDQIDANEPESARAEQSAEDNAARLGGAPADEGGEG
jgi:hypothetical protein